MVKGRADNSLLLGTNGDIDCCLVQMVTGLVQMVTGRQTIDCCLVQTVTINFFLVQMGTGWVGNQLLLGTKGDRSRVNNQLLLGTNGDRLGTKADRVGNRLLLGTNGRQMTHVWYKW